MGWANCGTDSEGRPIGYAVKAICDHPDCDKEIWRGVDRACGGMHGFTEYGCDKYFCEEHLNFIDIDDDDAPLVQLCEKCVIEYEDAKREENISE